MQILKRKIKTCLPIGKGFTLIELLVVIALIGLLTTIVTVSVNSSRNKAKNNTIKAVLNSLRAGGSMYINNTGSYLNFCVHDNCGQGSTDWQKTCASLKLNNASTTVSCNATTTAWCASSLLPGGGSYCVDSTNKTTGGTCPVSPANPVCP